MIGSCLFPRRHTTTCVTGLSLLILFGGTSEPVTTCMSINFRQSKINLHQVCVHDVHIKLCVIR